MFGKDIDRAVNDVRDAVTRVRGELPGSINEPVITRSTTSGGPMMTYTVKASGARARAELSWFVDNDVTKTLLTVPGVGQVKRVGGVEREIVIALEPERLNAYGITAAEVSTPAARTSTSGRARRQGRRWARAEQSIRTLGTRADASTRCATCRSRCATGARCA